MPGGGGRALRFVRRGGWLPWTGRLSGGQLSRRPWRSGGAGRGSVCRSLGPRRSRKRAARPSSEAVSCRLERSPDRELLACVGHSPRTRANKPIPTKQQSKAKLRTRWSSLPASTRSQNPSFSSSSRLAASSPQSQQFRPATSA